MKRIAIYLMAIIPVFLLSGCKTLSTQSMFGAVPKPRVESITPRIDGLDFQGVNLAFDVGVLNPYSVPIKTPQFKYGLDVEGASFLNSEATSKLDLPAKGVGTVTLPVRLEYLDLWRSYQNLKDAAEIPYILRGALVFSPLGETVELPLEKSGVFPILRMPHFSAVKVEPAQVSLGSAKVAVNMDVMNPNVFALGLEKLGYALKLGNIEVGSVQATALKEIKAGQSQSLSLSGAISGYQAVTQLLSGVSPGAVNILPSGSLKTPYGEIAVPLGVK